MTPSAARRLRWNAWRVVVVGTLSADAVVATSGSRIAAVVAIGLLAAMFALLATTPTDAIVLPRGRSERFIVYGATAIYAIAAFRVHDATVAIWSLVAIGVVLGLLTFAHRLHVSAWWVALVAWNPIFFLLAARR